MLVLSVAVDYSVRWWLYHITIEFGHLNGVEDVVGGLERVKFSTNEYDTSNFEKDHPLYSTANHRVLGKFKSETGSREFVGLRAKMYSLDCGKKSQKKAKGVKKHVVKKNVQDFLAVLKREKMNTVAKFNTFKSTNHVLNTVQMTKLCLNAFDDKRFILEDGSNTLPYGHYNIV